MNCARQRPHTPPLPFASRHTHVALAQLFSAGKVLMGGQEPLDLLQHVLDVVGRHARVPRDKLADNAAKQHARDAAGREHLAAARNRDHWLEEEHEASLGEMRPVHRVLARRGAGLERGRRLEGREEEVDDRARLGVDLSAELDCWRL
jgi:hypothetical protein